MPCKLFVIFNTNDIIKGLYMPIRPENMKRYPKNWKQITTRIMERAGNCCEGSPRYPDCRVANYSRHEVTGSKVILTVAHLDHMPENCGDDNLRAWCQRCHNTYDAPHRALTRKLTKFKNRLNVFCGVNDFSLFIHSNNTRMEIKSEKGFSGKTVTSLTVENPSGEFWSVALFFSLFDEFKTWYETINQPTPALTATDKE